MDFWIFFFRSLSYSEYSMLLMFWCGIYFLFVAPTIFRFWIIPKIENRYRVALTLDSSVYLFPWPNWSAPPFEISAYIFFKFMDWNNVRGINNPLHGRLLETLKKINYNVETASKAEIVMSFVSVFFFACLVFSGLVVAITIH